MIKNVKKKARVQHLPDSCLHTSLEWRESSEKIKYIQSLQLMKATLLPNGSIFFSSIFTGLFLLQRCLQM
jgi:hypothetical protein